VLFQFFTPKRLKCPAAAVQSIHFSKIAMFTLQITKYYFTGSDSRVVRHFLTTLEFPESKSINQVKRYPNRVNLD
jgi:hypothetical protein